MTDAEEIAIGVYLICAVATGSALEMRGERWPVVAGAFVLVCVCWPLLWAAAIWDRVRAVLQEKG